jgi:hypothetical protein
VGGESVIAGRDHSFRAPGTYSNVHICMASVLTGSTPMPAQIGGSARDYLLGFAWLVGPVMVQRASGCPYVYASASSG